MIVYFCSKNKIGRFASKRLNFSNQHLLGNVWLPNAPVDLFLARIAKKQDFDDHVAIFSSQIIIFAKIGNNNQVSNALEACK